MPRDEAQNRLYFSVLPVSNTAIIAGDPRSREKTAGKNAP
jgi:hypothetical protein